MSQSRRDGRPQPSLGLFGVIVNVVQWLLHRRKAGEEDEEEGGGVAALVDQSRAAEDRMRRICTMRLRGCGGTSRTSEATNCGGRVPLMSGYFGSGEGCRRGVMGINGAEGEVGPCQAQVAMLVRRKASWAAYQLAREAYGRRGRG